MHAIRHPWRLALLSLAAAGLVGLSSGARADDPPKPPPAPKPPEQPAPAPKEGEKPAEPSDKFEPEKAKDFTLKDVDGKEHKLADYAGKWIVLEWTNYGCPFVKKHYKMGDPPAEGKPPVPGHMQQLQATYTKKGVVWLSICSSAPGREGNMSPDKWKEAMKERQAAPTAMLLDEDGKVGHAYGSKNTPTLFVVDPKGMVIYHGGIDDAPNPRSNPAEAEHKYVVEVLDAVLAGKEAPVHETKPYG